MTAKRIGSLRCEDTLQPSDRRHVRGAYTLAYNTYENSRKLYFPVLPATCSISCQGGDLQL